MSYKLKHPIWFPNRVSHTTNQFGIEPNSKFMYTENELNVYMNSASMMSQALLSVSNQVTNNSAQLVATKNSDESYTDGKNIVIGMNPINSYEDLWTGMDIEMGLACHESCHCAYTDFNDYSLKKVNMPLAHWIHNVYEDECIEEMLGLRYSQWMYFLNSVISHYFNEKKFIDSIKKMISVNSDTEDIEIVQFMLLYMVRQSRLSSRFPEEWLDKFGMMLDEIYEKVIVEIQDPKMFKYSPTVNTSRATLQTIEIMKKYIDMSELEKKLKKPMLGMIGNSSTEGNPNGGKTCGENGLYSPNTKEGRKKSNASIGQRHGSAKNKIDEEKKNAANKKNGSQNSENEYGDPTDPIRLFRGARKEIGAAKPRPGDISKYKKLVKELQEEIQIAKRIIIPNTKKIELTDDNFHRNGQLIPSQLAQAIQGVNCVYHRKVVKTSDNNDPRYALVLALDESGSTEPIFNIVTQIAVTFYEAMKNFPGVDLYIYGHGDNIVKYITPKDKVPYKISNRKLQGGQNEYIAYSTILSDVKLQTTKPILFINITDSMYLAQEADFGKFIERTRSKKLQYGLLSISKYSPTDISNKFNEVLTRTNNNIYGESNWITVQPNKDGLRKALKSFGRVIRTKYELK